MLYASITGWGEGMPHAVLTNEDLSTLLREVYFYRHQLRGHTEREYNPGK